MCRGTIVLGILALGVGTSASVANAGDRLGGVTLAATAAQNRNALILVVGVLLVTAAAVGITFLRERQDRDGDPDFWRPDGTPSYLDLLGALAAFRADHAQERQCFRDLALLRAREQEESDEAREALRPRDEERWEG